MAYLKEKKVYIADLETDPIRWETKDIQGNVWRSYSVRNWRQDDLHFALAFVESSCQSHLRFFGGWKNIPFRKEVQEISHLRDDCAVINVYLCSYDRKIPGLKAVWVNHDGWSSEKAPQKPPMVGDYSVVRYGSDVYCIGEVYSFICSV